MQLPAHAYVPGQNERHPEDTFDTLRQTAMRAQDVPALAQCDAFQAGLRFLDAGYYWEAHEVLEPVWMALPDVSVERRFVQGLIQLANGCLKLRMNRPKAALRLVGIARELVPSGAQDELMLCGAYDELVPSGAQELTVMTVDTREVHRWIDALERAVSDRL